jgi:hypothetical protein
MTRRPKTPTDNSRAFAHILRKRPGLQLVSSGHVLEWTSSCVTDPKCEKLPDYPSRDQIDAMVEHDITKYYGELIASSSWYAVPRGAVFSKRAIIDTANEFLRTDEQITKILREAGYGRGKAVTAQSS